MKKQDNKDVLDPDRNLRMESEYVVTKEKK